MKRTIKKLTTALLVMAMAATLIPTAYTSSASESPESLQADIMSTSISTRATDFVSRSLGKLNATFMTNSLTATSNSSPVTINASSVSSNGKITSVVLNMTKSSASTGNIVVYVKVGTKVVGKTYSNTLTFTEFNGLSPAGSWEIYFVSTRPMAGTLAAATISSGTFKVNYSY